MKPDNISHFDGLPVIHHRGHGTRIFLGLHYGILTQHSLCECRGYLSGRGLALWGPACR